MTDPTFDLVLRAERFLAVWRHLHERTSPGPWEARTEYRKADGKVYPTDARAVTGRESGGCTVATFYGDDEPVTRPAAANADFACFAHGADVAGLVAELIAAITTGKD